RRHPDRRARRRRGALSRTAVRARSMGGTRRAAQAACAGLAAVARLTAMNETSGEASPIRIAIDDESSVSGLLQSTPGARACLVLAHGAGAGMTHPFMAAVAEGLASRGIATLRYQFAYMEQ